MSINQNILDYSCNIYNSSPYLLLTKKKNPIQFKKIKSVFKRIHDSDKITYFRFCYGNCKGILAIFRDGYYFCLEEFKLYTLKCSHTKTSIIKWI